VRRFNAAFFLFPRFGVRRFNATFFFGQSASGNRKKAAMKLCRFDAIAITDAALPAKESGVETPHSKRVAAGMRFLAIGR
jgi:hypothetical protein